MRRSPFLVLMITLALLTVGTAAAEPLTTAEAKSHVGEHATVCGRVASTKYAAGSRGRPTFLNLDRPYPDHIFTIVIWSEDRAKFGTPEKTYAGETVCVTGTIQTYKGKPQIIARSPSQLRIVLEDGVRRPDREGLTDSSVPVGAILPASIRRKNVNTTGGSSSTRERAGRQRWPTLSRWGTTIPRAWTFCAGGRSSRLQSKRSTPIPTGVLRNRLRSKPPTVPYTSTTLSL